MTKKAIAILITLCMLLTVSCGKKAPPMPPNRALPLSPQIVSVKVEENGILLMIRLPDKDKNGAPIDDFKRIEVFRAKVKDESAFCPDCKEGYEKLEHAIYKGRKAASYDESFFDAGVDAGLYYYKARVGLFDENKEKGISSFSAPIKALVEAKK